MQGEGASRTLRVFTREQAEQPRQAWHVSDEHQLAAFSKQPVLHPLRWIRRLKSALANVRVILADPVGSALADWIETGTLGPDGAYAVEGIGGSEVPQNLHRDVIDGVERVSDEDSFAMVKRLLREEGLYVGGSAGTNVVAALRIAARGELDGPVVTVLPDSWDRYRTQPWMQGWSVS